MKEIKINNQTLVVGDNQNFHGVDYWEKVANKSWEPFTFQILDMYLKPKNELIDIGAWIGPISLYASKICSKVYAVEPDDVALKMLKENISLNSINNIVVVEEAISNDGAPLNIYSPDSENLFGVSTTNTFGRGFKGRSVPSFTIEQFWDRFQPQNVSLLKMDIEGGEFDILPKCANYLVNKDITIYVACHYPIVSDDVKLQNLIFAAKKYDYVLDTEFKEIRNLEEYIKSRLTEIILTNHHYN